MQMAKDDNLLHEKTDQMLQQIRVVLPGTEALLGFQFVVFFNKHFNKLPAGIKYIHLANLLLIVTANILLISPVAFRQIKEAGRDTQSFLNFASKSVLGAMIFLLLGLSGDVYVAARLTVPEDADSVAAITLGLGVLILGVIIWYFLPWWFRRKK